MPSSYRYQTQYTQSDVEGYAIADVVLGSLTLVAAIAPLWIGMRLKQSKDGTRSWVPWLKASVVGFTLFVVLHLASATVYLAAYEVDVHSYLSNRLQMLQIQNYLATSSSFIQQVTQAAILVALIRLGSFLLSADGRMDKQPHKLLDMVTVGGCVLAGLIAATAFALSCSALSWLDHEAHPHEVDVQILAYYRIAFTYLVVIFAFAFAAMVYATVVGVCVQSSFRNKGYWCLLISCVLLLTSTMYNLVSYSVYRDPSGRLLKTPELYLKVLEYVFSIWPLYGILILFCTLGRDSLSGVWSEQTQFKDSHHF